MSFHGSKSVGIAFIAVFFILSIWFGGKRVECSYEMKKNEKKYEKLMKENEMKNQIEIKGN